MKPLIPKPIEAYAESCTTNESPLLKALIKETCKKMDNPQMLIGKTEGQFLKLLIRISGAKKILEIGTFTGYSALIMAEGLPDNGRLITCEVSEKSAEIAARYFRKSPHGGKIRLKLAPAIDTLKKMRDESFDFVFIDADKSSYPRYYDESMRVLKRGGLIVADNSLWSGKVIDPEDDDSRAIARFNRKVKRDSRVEKVMLTVRDGLYLIRKN
jgi:caffeoyl-CoA O-methyltransferase